VKNLYWIIGIVVLTFAADRIGGMILDSMVQKSQFRYSRIYNQSTKNTDILLVGNSRGLTFFQPEIERLTAKSTLNIAYNGMPMNLASTIIEDQISLNGAPKVALIDITMCDRNNKEMINGFKTYATRPSSLTNLIKENDPKVYYGCKVSHIFRYNSEIFQRALYYRNKSDKDWLLDRVISPTMINNAATMQPFQLDTFANQVKKLKEIIGILETKGTKVHLVVGPYYPTFKLTGLDNFIHSVENITSKKVNNYSSLLKNDEEFGDYQHPNIKGSKIYMEQLNKDSLFSF
jgi:hypothetical protein